MEGLLGYLGDVTKATCVVTFSLGAELRIGGVSSKTRRLCVCGAGETSTGHGRRGLMGVKEGTGTGLSRFTGSIAKCLELFECLILESFHFFLQTRA